MNTGAVRDWVEYEIAKLKVESKEQIERYFQERKEHSYNVKVWPRFKDYAAGGTFYVVWCKTEYINAKRRVMRTKHLSKGREVSYRGKLKQACRHCAGEMEYVLSYEDRFVLIRQKVAALGKMLSALNKIDSLEKGSKECFFASQNE